jgi:hypothetical protein
MENIMMDWWLVSAFKSLVLEIVKHAYSGGRKKSGWKARMIQKGLFLRSHHVILPHFIVFMTEFDHRSCFSDACPDNLRTGFERPICNDADAPTRLRKYVQCAATSDGVVILYYSKLG